MTDLKDVCEDMSKGIMSLSKDLTGWLFGGHAG